MKSKEALKIIKYRTEDEPAIMGDDIYDMLDVIERDLERLEIITKILTDMIEEDKTGWLEMTNNYGKYLNEIEDWLNEK